MDGRETNVNTFIGRGENDNKESDENDEDKDSGNGGGVDDNIGGEPPTMVTMTTTLLTNEDVKMSGCLDANGIGEEPPTTVTTNADVNVSGCVDTNCVGEEPLTTVTMTMAGLSFTEIGMSTGSGRDDSVGIENNNVGGESMTSHRCLLFPTHNETQARKGGVESGIQTTLDASNTDSERVMAALAALEDKRMLDILCWTQNKTADTQSENDTQLENNSAMVASSLQPNGGAVGGRSSEIVKFLDNSATTTQQIKRKIMNCDTSLNEDEVNFDAFDHTKEGKKRETQDAVKTAKHTATNPRDATLSDKLNESQQALVLCEVSNKQELRHLVQSACLVVPEEAKLAMFEKKQKQKNDESSFENRQSKMQRN